MARRVLPQPAPPHTRVALPRGRPPSVISSSPRMPVGHLRMPWGFAFGDRAFGMTLLRFFIIRSYPMHPRSQARCSGFSTPRPPFSTMNKWILRLLLPDPVRRYCRCGGEHMVGVIERPIVYRGERWRAVERARQPSEPSARRPAPARVRAPAFPPRTGPAAARQGAVRVR